MRRKPSVNEVIFMPFVKGVSPNPGGRPKGMQEVRELARIHSKKAIMTLVKMLESEQDRVKVQAAEALLDRGFGKPTQPVAGDDTMPPILVATRLAGLDDAELQQMVRQAVQRADGDTE